MNLDTCQTAYSNSAKAAETLMVCSVDMSENDRKAQPDSTGGNLIRTRSG